MNAAVGAPGRIGPNAITRLAEVLPGFVGRTATTQLFDSAGLANYLRTPPQGMVDEVEVTRLHAALRVALGAALAGRVAQAAGRRTGDYLLAHRIPKPVQLLLRMLPPPLAARVLLSAIRRHAWTFAGSGVFTAHAGPPVRLTIHGNPLCKGVAADEPVCAFYAATFERLFSALVHEEARVAETACEARGDPQCVFEVSW